MLSLLPVTQPLPPTRHIASCHRRHTPLRIISPCYVYITLFERPPSPRLDSPLSLNADSGSPRPPPLPCSLSRSSLYSLLFSLRSLLLFANLGTRPSSSVYLPGVCVVKWLTGRDLHRATECNGHAELCDRSYGNVTFLGGTVSQLFLHANAESLTSYSP